MAYKNEELTRHIIEIFYKVYNSLGYGFLEKVYENALMIEFKKSGLDAKPQTPIKVVYDRQIVGEYYIDLLVEDCVIVEIKASKSLAKKHEAQLLNYLKASRIEVGLLLNFGPTPEIKRKVFDNHRK
jgi:GxxExxY protein